MGEVRALLFFSCEVVKGKPCTIWSELYTARAHSAFTKLKGNGA
jgi:hypothetical protein